MPRLGLASLLVCLLSGLVLTYQYHPFGNVFKNVEEITTVIPYGFFFRRLHYASGQLFVILVLLHSTDHFLRRRYRRYSVRKWALLVIPLGICFFILFTGYILKGDKDGIYAGNIFYNILRDIPVLGDTIARFVMRPGETFYWLPYLYHSIFLPILLIFLIRDHIFNWFPDTKLFLIATAVLSVYSLFVRMPLDIPPHADIRVVMGPWFFLGIQVCLSVISPLLVGIVMPLIFFALLLLLPLLRNRLQGTVHYSIIISSLFYACLIIFGYFFMEHSWGISR
ncbi:cytochrome b N-terminal domain-containing protein [Nitrospinota bacterium]